MSLKTFHLFFIAVCVVLAAFVAAWAGQQYRTVSGVGYVITAVAALASGAGLALYGAKFQKKMRRIS
jgi:hypothetical protein